VGKPYPGAGAALAAALAALLGACSAHTPTRPPQPAPPAAPAPGSAAGGSCLPPVSAAERTPRPLPEARLQAAELGLAGPAASRPAQRCGAPAPGSGPPPLAGAPAPPEPAPDDADGGGPPPASDRPSAAAAVRPANAYDETPRAAEPPPSGAPDLWDRIRAGLRLPVPDHPRVRRELAWLARNPDYLERVSRRARPFLRHIVAEVEARDMPLEIALLPIVESAFQPFAYSHGRAAGIWQIIPGTARRLGVRMSWWYDGRRDIVESTRAALDYLERLHAHFGGDWLLALAAYNAGEGNVDRAIARNRRRGRPTDFWHLRLPRETRTYVPRLLAVAAVVREPARHGVRLVPIPDEPHLAVVPTGGQIDLALAARLADMALEDLYRYNPGLNRWATDPRGPHRLVLPRDRAAAFEARLAEIPPHARVRWTRHRVRRGETLGHIARRYRVTVADIRRVNRIRGHLIRAGQSLLIPVASQGRAAYSLSADARRARLRATPRGDRKVVHRVRRGDTLWDIARAYGVPVRRLARWNGLALRDPLRPGDTLVVWLRDGRARAHAARPVSAAAVLPEETRRTIHYVVRRGDSLSRIARRFRVSVRDLVRWNGLRLSDYLRPGQRLKVHVDVTRLGAG